MSPDYGGKNLLNFIANLYSFDRKVKIRPSVSLPSDHDSNLKTEIKKVLTKMLIRNDPSKIYHVIYFSYILPSMHIIQNYHF